MLIQPATRPGPNNGLRQQAEMVHIANLRRGFSPRVVLLDRAHIQTLTEVVDRLPPILVHHATMTVIDGLHRLEAHRQIGRQVIAAHYFHGDHAAAVILAIRANVTHGKPLTRSERRTAAQQLLVAHPARSDRWIAEICGISHSTVGHLRQILRASNEAQSTKRLGRDGKFRSATSSPGDRPAGASTVSTPVPANGEPHVVEPGGDPIADFTPTSSCHDLTRWLQQTDIQEADLGTLRSVQLNDVSRFADECRRRAALWTAAGAALDERADQQRT